MLSTSTHYDKSPYVAVSQDGTGCSVQWSRIIPRLRSAIAPARFVVCVECYPGVTVAEISETLEAGLRPGLTVRAEDCYHPCEVLERRLAPQVTDDPVFGRMGEVALNDFLDPLRVGRAHTAIRDCSKLVLVVGPGASLIAEDWDLLIYATVSRWEIQQRQRRGEIGNLGIGNIDDSPQAKYKRAFFVDWRAADRLKRPLYDRIDFLLDVNCRAVPKLISGADFRAGLAAVIRRPFRVAPFFDPGPWGGEWMRRTFDLPADAPNFAWGFDCVPEENSLLLGFGRERVELPAIDVVFRHPRELLGNAIFERFGAEFPIRFDLLDTIEGGNLSLQVHPLTGYIREQFGLSYTQDESYYILDAAPDSSVYLGLKNGVDPSRMVAALKAAQQRDAPFPAEKYVNAWPARKHDHFLIPAGTIHCSGRNTVVLEISATPYIFTFKLWEGPDGVGWGAASHSSRPRNPQRAVESNRGMGTARVDQSRGAARNGRGMERGAHRFACARIHRSAPPLVHRTGAARYARDSERAQSRAGR